MTPSRAVKTVAALGMLSSVVWASTYAAFSDQVDVATGTFTAGTLDIAANDGPAFTTLMTAGNMKPGDAVYAPLTISNPGSLAATYGMGVTALGGNGLPLTVSVKSGVSACSAAGYGVGGTVVFADAALGAAGFSGRNLQASVGTDALCFKLELPSTADNTAQGKTASVTFRFTAAPTAS